MKSYSQFREEESALDMKRQELMKNKGKAADDFKKKSKQDDMNKRIEKNKAETDQKLANLEYKQDMQIAQLRRQMGA